jgi:predicted amidohydrolase YtcJ
MITKIFYGVPFYTMDADRDMQEAVVVVNGKVDYITSNPNEAHNLYPDAELVELSGGCVIPGFVDAHLHLKEYAVLFKDLDFSRAADKNDVLRGVESALSEKKDGQWVQAAGLEKANLFAISKDELDSFSPNNPLLLFSNDMRVVLANSKALEHAGIDESRSDPLGGKIGRDANGQPNGLLYDRGIDSLWRVIPEDKVRVVESSIEKGLHKILSYGITTICDCSIKPGSDSIRSIMKLLWRDKLKVRVVVMFGEQDALRLGEMGFASQFGNDYFRMGGFSIVVDGALSSRTGYMTKPYRGGSSSGMLLMDEEELHAILKSHYSNYFWAGVQCAGDGANEIALRVFRKMGSEVGIPRLLKRIDMAMALKDEDIDEFAKNSIIPVMMPCEILSNREDAIRYLGTEAKLLYRFKSLIDSGAALAFASDAPRAPLNPLYGIYVAIERKGFTDGPELRFYPKESISLHDALYAYTKGSATACGMEKEVGSLEVGKYADFVHLSGDIYAENTENLKNISVLDVFVGGNSVI